MSEMNPFKILSFKGFVALGEFLVLAGLCLDQVQVLSKQVGGNQTYQGSKNWSFSYFSVYELVYDERDVAQERRPKIDQWLAQRLAERRRR